MIDYNVFLLMLNDCLCPKKVAKTVLGGWLILLEKGTGLKTVDHQRIEFYAVLSSPVPPIAQREPVRHHEVETVPNCVGIFLFLHLTDFTLKLHDSLFSNDFFGEDFGNYRRPHRKT